jgi:hypothetical protein
MSIHSKSSNAVKKIREDVVPETTGGQMAEIIPWPDVPKISSGKKAARRTARLEGKYLYCRGRKIPILQFQKAGYDRLLKLLVKEIG